MIGSSFLAGGIGAGVGEFRALVLPVVLTLVLAELIWRRWRAGWGYDLGAAFGSFGVMIVGILPKQLGNVVTGAVLFAASALAPWQMPLDDWRVWVAGFVAVEFVYYWFHRFSHTVRWFWANHAVHHSSNEFVLPSAYRLGWFGAVMGTWIFFAPLVLIGFPAVLVVGLLSANLLYQFLLHTETVGRLGPLEWVLNTPSHHRAHHSREEAWLDCNFGGVVIVFDRLFGTFRQEPQGRRLAYGLVHPQESNNPLRIGLQPLIEMIRDARAAPGIKGALAILLSSPAQSERLAARFRGEDLDVADAATGSTQRIVAAPAK